jgi:hypothetical protein
MLRYAFFPDFKSGPKLLLWGDNADMLTLSAFFRQMAVAPREFDLSEVGFCPAAGDTVIVVPQEGESGGVTRVTGKEKVFQWKLDAASAERFAGLVDVLSARIGHQYLEHLRSSGEIVVMAYGGEYPHHLVGTKRITIFSDYSDGELSADYKWVTAWLERWKPAVRVAGYSTGGWEHHWDVEGPEAAIAEVPARLLCASAWTMGSE